MQKKHLLADPKMMAISYGGELHVPKNSPKTLTSALLETVAKYPTKGISCIDENGQKIFQTYPELLVQAKCILAGLRKRGCQVGDSAILQITQLHNHFATFWGCILGGVIPVVINVAQNYHEKNALTDKFFNVYRLLHQPIIITNNSTQPDISKLALLYQLPTLQIYTIEELSRECAIDSIYFSEPSRVLFYQLSSGSTGVPKCIQITHKGVIAHIHGSIQHVGYSANDICLNWMPYDHSGSAIWAHLRSVYLGCNQIAVKTNYILSNPLKWLDLIQEYQVTHSWSPNFGYKIVTEAVKKRNNHQWNLTSLKYLMTGSEQITLPVIVEFIQCLQASGITAKMIQPSYGMSETSTVIVYHCDFNLNTEVYWVNKNSLETNLIADSDHKNAVAFISLGIPIPGVSIRITDGNNHVLPEGVIGHLQIKGDVITPGYINNYEANKEIFVCDEWLNSGDMGFIINGNLVLTGRQKEIIIINGANHFCYEIEDIVSTIPGVLPTFVASTSILDETIGTESLAIFFVPEVEDIEVVSQLCKTIKNQLAQSIGLSPTYVIPIIKERFYKTTGGKIQRMQFKKELQEGKFKKIIKKIVTHHAKRIIKPKTVLEKVIAKIWYNILGIDKISTTNSFFELGGDSIVALRIVSTINKELGANISLLVIFKHSTIKELAHYIEQNNQDNAIIVKSVITEPEEQLLSFAQERLWFIEKYEQGTNAYNIPMVFKLTSNINLDILEISIRTIVARHEVLRTLIKEDNKGNGYQLILDDKEHPLKIKKLIVTDRVQLEEELERAVNHIYDLSNEYSIRVCLYELINNDAKVGAKYYLSIVIHHIAFDGWSTDIFLRELHAYYNYYLAQSQGLVTKLNLPELTIQYKDFALWQRHYLSEERLDKQLNYWKNKLSDYETLNLITDKPRSLKIDYSGKDIYFELDEVISQQLRELAKELKVSLYSLLLAGYYLMLRAYTNQEDIVVGTPIANRHYRQTEHLIGFFVNSLALRTQINSNITIIEFIQAIGQDVVEAQLYQDLPFEKLVEELKVIKDTSRHPIFQVMFGVQSFGGKSYKQTGEQTDIGLTDLLQEYTTPTGANLHNIARFDITTFINDSKKKLTGSFNYATSIYVEDTIQGYIDTYKVILQQLAKLFVNSQGQVKVSDLIYLNSAQYEQIIYKWNKTDKFYPHDKTISQLFEEQVKYNSDNIAILDGNSELTYKELNERANKLAHYLKSIYQIEPDDLIALYLNRNEHMLIGILATLKAGGAYVPIDPSYPDTRTKYILQDTNARVILTNEIYKQQLEDITKNILDNDVHNLTIAANKSFKKPLIEVVAIDTSKLTEQLPVQFITNLQKTKTTSNNLAYVIYTSGTTGNPKGVMIEHKTYIATISSIKNLYFKDKLKINTYSTTNYVFDIFGLEYGLPLLNGGNLTLGTSDFSSLDCSIYDFIQLTPSLCDLKLEYLKNTLNIKLLIGGENLNYNLLSRILAKSINTINVYGPTETTIWSTSKLYNYKENLKLRGFAGILEHGITTYSNTHEDVSLDSTYTSSTTVEFCQSNLLHVSLGRPLDNEKVYVLDTNLKPLPIKAIGELYIGGEGLARGYLNRLELTEEKFINNPFQSEEEKKLDKNSRLYKTGDLVRLLPNGDLEYIGRNDFQVKVRGYRIELGEIETTLSSYPGIKQSLVLANEHLNMKSVSTENKYLVSYYVADNKLNVEDLIHYLQSKLPEYMIPKYYIQLEQFPLTINGKLNRKALSTPEVINKDNYIAPRNELEYRICYIWAEVLGLSVEQVGIYDDFFRLGGNSILSIKLVNKLNKNLDTTVSVASIFNKYNTVDKLARSLKNNNKEHTIIKASNTTVEEQLLSFAQERLWFIEKYEEGTNAYNIPLIYKLSSDVKLDILETSIRHIVSRHEILRTLIKEDSSAKNYQLILDDTKYPLIISKIFVTNHIQLEQELAKYVNHIYSLSDEYPIKTCIYELRSSSTANVVEYYLSIVIHHIAFDGWSIDILLQELQEYYRYFLKQLQGIETNLNLPTLTIQYKDFAIWQRNYLSGTKLVEQLNYWKNKLQDYESLNLIPDKPRANYIDYKGEDIYFEIDHNTSIALRELAKELKVSLYSVLLAGYYLMLKTYSNQDDLIIGSPIANRHYTKVENLIGCFVNSLALRVKIDSTNSIKEFIQTVWQEVVKAQFYQDLPFEKLVEELRVVKDTSVHPIFQVMFGVQGFTTLTSKESSQSNNDSLTQLLYPYKTTSNLYNVAKFDITTFIDDSQKQLTGSFNYAVSLYTKDTIERYIVTYTGILQQLATLVNDKKKQENTKIDDLRYLSTEEYKQVIDVWNQTASIYSHEKTVHALFEEQVERTPNNIAVIYEDISLTYKELNERANQLAHYIANQTDEILSNTLITLCLNRSEQLLIAILAILKVGGAYVPIDPSYPDTRIQYIVKDTNSKLILTNEVYLKKLGALNVDTIINQTETDREINLHVKILAIDNKTLQEQLESQPNINPSTVLDSTNLAYVIYTSGTTGQPKGVMIEHRGIVNRIEWMNASYKLDEKDIVLQKTPYVFDVSVWELLWPIWYGACIVFAQPETHKDASYLIELINKKSITIVHFVPSMLEMFLHTLKTFSPNPIKNLKYIFCSGEPLILKQVQVCHTILPSTAVHNLYGPTEASIDVLYYPCTERNISKIYIGKPIFNTKCYVLNTHLAPLPIKAVGELYVGGIGLARGYLNQLELTAEKFIANPFQSEEAKLQEKNTKLYKTGDLVRWLPDGNLEYLGRNDFQVKIRGYRIELGEIENILLNYEGIKQSVVLAKEHVSTGGTTTTGNRYLVGYYVSNDKLDEKRILAYLQARLPNYMVPSVLVHLDKLPLTINGKLDRKALPTLEFTKNVNYTAPNNEIEKKVCAIWAEILSLPENTIGTHDDFFDLGGNSILVMKLILRLKQEFDVDLSLRMVFECPILFKLSEILIRTKAEMLN